MAVMRQDYVIPSLGNNVILKEWDLTGVVSDPNIKTVTTSNQVIGKTNHVIISEVSNPVLDTFRTFSGLLDTPIAYTGSNKKIPVVDEPNKKLVFKSISEIADDRFVKKSGDTLSGNLIIDNKDNARLHINGGDNKNASVILTEDDKINGFSLFYNGSSDNDLYLKGIENNVSNNIFYASRDAKRFKFYIRPQYQPNGDYFLIESDCVDSLTSTNSNSPLSASQGKELKSLIDDRYTKSESDTKFYNKVESDNKFARKRNAADIGTGTANSNKILYGDMVWRDQTILAAEVLTGTLAKRPAAATSNKGDFYVISGDTPQINGEMFISDGTKWIVIEYPKASYTKAEADSRFLGLNDKSKDSHKLDGLDSTAFLRVADKAADTEKLDGRTKAQVVAESRSGLATTGYAYSKAQSDGRYLPKAGKAVDAAKADYIKGHYVSGGRENPSYFGAGKAKLQMLQTGWGYADTFWMSSYSGGDVKGSNQLVISKTSAKIGFRRQNYDSKTWGTLYEIYHTGRKPTAADVGALTQSTADKRYLKVAAKAADSAKLDGKTKAQVVAEARSGLATTGYAYSKAQSDGRYLPKAGKATDSLHLNGASDSVSPKANTIVKRDSASDVLCRLVRSSYANQTTINGAIAFRTNNTSDNYVRFCSSNGAVRKWMDVYSKGESNKRYLGIGSKARDSDKIDGYDISQLFRRIDSTTDYKTTRNIMSCQEFDNKLPVGLSGAYNYGTLLTINDNSTRLRIYAPHKEGSSSAMYFNTGYGTDQRPWERVLTYHLGDARYYRSGSNAHFGEITANRLECGFNHNVSNAVGCSNWFRSSGASGWLNASYGGGIYMRDKTYIRTYGGKKFYVDSSDVGHAIHTAGGINTEKQFNVKGKKFITGHSGTGKPSASSVAVGGLYVRW